MKSERVVLADAAAVAAEAQARLRAAAEEALARRGRFDLALSGGSTPLRLYAALAALPPATFAGWHLWWGDERCVPHDHPDSNFGAFASAFLQRVPLDAGQLHPVPTASVTPHEAAGLYEHELEHALAGEGLDLVLLGIGADGHTASLFPGAPALRVHDRLVVDTEPPAPPAVARARVTLTLPALEHARALLFVVCGADKRAALERLDALAAPSPALPASLARSGHGPTLWLCDRAAAPAAG